MLADISLFESLGKTNGQTVGGINAIFNNLPVLFDQYEAVQSAYNKGNEFLKSIISPDAQATEILAHSITDAMGKYSTDLLQLREKIRKEAENNGLSKEDRLAYLEMSDKIKSDFQDLFATDDIIRKTNELIAGETVFNNWSLEEKRNEYNRLLSEFTTVCKDVIGERSETLSEQDAEQYRQLASYSLQTAIDSFQDLAIDKSELSRFDTILQKFCNSVNAVEIAVQRPRMKLDRIQSAGANLRRVVQT